MLISAIAIVACSQYDDSVISERIDNLDSRVSALEKWQTQINSQIQTLQTAIDALNKQDQITNVRKLDNEAGWEITFSKSGTITVHNGTNGIDGSDGSDGKDGVTPTIGVKLDDDGSYYWTVNGEYLLDNSGNKISATSHISTPQIRINQDTNKFEISYNNGATWEEIGDAGNSSFGIFSNIVEDLYSVIFYLSDGTSITIPKKVALALILNGSSFGVSAGIPTLISYSVEGADDATSVDGFATNGYEVIVSSTSASEGQIIVTPPSPLVAGKLFLVAFNEKESATKVLSFEEGKLIIDENALSVPAVGGSVEFTVSTNMEYSVRIDNAALSWISLVETKSLRQEIVTLNIRANESLDSRTGKVDLINGAGDVLQSVSIIQAGTGSSQSGGGKDDFSTFNGGEKKVTYANYSSESGWTLENGMIYDSANWEGFPNLVPVLGGRKSKPGVLTSPLFNGGCGKLKFSYGSSATLNAGISLKLELKDNDGNILKDYTITDATATTKTQYDFDETINIAGEFKIVITNLCPAGKTTGSFDATGIFNLEWTGYAE